jgi:aspartate/methionine/tyrosine aminotransferase
LDLLAERFMQVGTATAAFSDSSVYCYDSTLGKSVARKAAAYFLARRFLFPEEPNLSPTVALKKIRPQHVCLTAGASSVINGLFFLLGDVGDACLIPAPYYAAFENDMKLVAGIVPCPVAQRNPVEGPSDMELEVAYDQARRVRACLRHRRRVHELVECAVHGACLVYVLHANASSYASLTHSLARCSQYHHQKGHNPKFVLVTNPNNPLGVIYRPEVIVRIVNWARMKGLHTIVDELYALSTHNVSATNVRFMLDYIQGLILRRDCLYSLRNMAMGFSPLSRF